MKINDWRQDYNQIRPHASMLLLWFGNRVPDGPPETDRIRQGAIASKITVETSLT